MIILHDFVFIPRHPTFCFCNNIAYLYHQFLVPQFGIVVPTYFWRLPRIVAEYLDKLRIENCGYTFSLASYGTTTGKAGSMAKKIMAHNEQNFDAYYSVIMPDTWTPVFDLMDKNRVDKWLSDGKKQLELVIGNIMSKRKGDFIDRKLPKWVAAILAAYMYATERKTKILLKRRLENIKKRLINP